MIETLPRSIQNLVHFLTESGTVTRVVLFGSRARNTARENSDYDLAFWVTDRATWSTLLVDLDDRPVTLLPVDLVLYDEASAELQARINQDGIKIYGD